MANTGQAVAVDSGPASKDSEVAIQLADMDKSLSELHEAIGGLEVALKPVLMMTKATGVNEAGAPEVTLAPLPEVMREDRKSLDNAISRLRSIRERLAL